MVKLNYLMNVQRKEKMDSRGSPRDKHFHVRALPHTASTPPPASGMHSHFRQYKSALMKYHIFETSNTKTINPSHFWLDPGNWIAVEPRDRRKDRASIEAVMCRFHIKYDAMNHMGDYWWICRIRETVVRLVSVFRTAWKRGRNEVSTRTREEETNLR